MATQKEILAMQNEANKAQTATTSTATATPKTTAINTSTATARSVPTSTPVVTPSQPTQPRYDTSMDAYRASGAEGHISYDQYVSNANKPLTGTPIDDARRQAIERAARAGEVIDLDPDEQRIYDIIRKGTVNEVHRKAGEGIGLTNPENVANKELYDSLISSGATSSSMSDAEVNQALSDLGGNPGGSSASNRSQLDQILSQLRSAYDAKLESDLANLESQRQAQLAEIQKAYNDAVAQGNMSIREAEEAFKQRETEINEEMYRASEARRLSASSRGIQNSQQLSGMEATDRVNESRLVNQNANQRDRRVADITDRIRAITQNRDIDIATLNQRHDALANQARSDNEFAYLSQSAGMQFSDYQSQQQFGQQVALAGLGHQYNLEAMDVGHGYNIDMHERQQQANRETLDYQDQLQQGRDERMHGYDLEKAMLQHGFNLDINDRQHVQRLSENAQRHGFNLEEMAVANDYNINKMQQQMIHEIGMANIRFEQENQLIDKNYALKNQALIDEYNFALEKELKKYNPDTYEYKIRQQQINEEYLGRMDDLSFEMQLSNVLDNPYLNKVMTQGFTDLPKNKTPTEKNVAEYNKERNAIISYNNMFAGTDLEVPVPPPYTGPESINAVTSFMRDFFTGTPQERELFNKIKSSASSSEFMGDLSKATGIAIDTIKNIPKNHNEGLKNDPFRTGLIEFFSPSMKNAPTFPQYQRDLFSSNPDIDIGAMMDAIGRMMPKLTDNPKDPYVPTYLSPEEFMELFNTDKSVVDQILEAVGRR